MKKAWGGKELPMNALVPPEDIWRMILPTVRQYLYGAMDLVSKYNDYLTENQLEQIENELHLTLDNERVGIIPEIRCDEKKKILDAIDRVKKMLAYKKDCEPF